MVVEGRGGGGLVIFLPERVVTSVICSGVISAMEHKYTTLPVVLGSLAIRTWFAYQTILSIFSLKLLSSHGMSKSSTVGSVKGSLSSKTTICWFFSTMSVGVLSSSHKFHDHLDMYTDLWRYTPVLLELWYRFCGGGNDSAHC